MSAPRILSIACDDFDTIRDLREGRVEVEGAQLHFETELTNPERHAAMVRHLAFDICELNVSTYLIAREQGVPITSLPIFLFRKFRHGSLYVRAGGQFTDPRQLAGKAIGVPNMQPASNVWLRGILRDDHGFDDSAVNWVVEKDEEIGFDLPANVATSRLSAGRSLTDALRQGEVDAIMTPLVPQAVIDGQTEIVRLFQDYVGEEQRYYQRTGLFPIMHVTAIRQQLVDEDPALVQRLLVAFEQSKQNALRRMRNVRLVSLAWFGAQWETERRLFGEDAFPNGLTALNRKNIATAIRYSHEQGLIASAPDVRDVFVAPA